MKTAERDAKLIAALCDRLAFERAAVGIYDEILGKMKNAPPVVTEALMRFRADEKAHAEWLKQEIEIRGGDPQESAQASLFVDRDTVALEQSIAHTSELERLLRALRAFEFFDNAGWEALLETARRTQNGRVKRMAKRCLHEEEEHLEFVCRAIDRVAQRVTSMRCDAVRIARPFRRSGLASMMQGF